MQKRRVKYPPDVLFFLIIIPFISAFNYYLTYTDIQFNGYLFLTFAIDTAQGYLAWWAVRRVIHYLDRHYPFSRSLIKRLLLQFALTFITGMGIIILTTELVSYIAKGRAAHASFYAEDVFIISIWFWFINAFYIGWHFYRQADRAQQENIKLSDKAQSLIQTPSEPITFSIRLGKEERLFQAEDIQLFRVEDEVVYLVDRTGRSVPTDFSLDKLEQQMKGLPFFRINRQALVSRQVIKGYRRLENGKLEVQLKQGVPQPVNLTISRTKAPVFKQWLSPTS